MRHEIKKTANTPYFALRGGLIRLKGRSHPLNPASFYKEIFKITDQYVRQPMNKTKIEISLDYINSSSNRALLIFLQKFNRLAMKGYQVELVWFYENEEDSMFDFGSIFKSLVSYPFKLKQIKAATMMC